MTVTRDRHDLVVADQTGATMSRTRRVSQANRPESPRTRRIRGLTATDQVKIVVTADLSDVSERLSADIVDLLIIGARSPGVTLQIVSMSTPSSILAAPRRCVDLSTQSGHNDDLVRQLLHIHRQHRGAVVRAVDGHVSLEPYGQLPRADREPSEDRSPTTTAYVLVTRYPDQPLQVTIINTSKPLGLGGQPQSMNLPVRDFAAALAVVETVVSLRTSADEAQRQW